MHDISHEIQPSTNLEMIMVLKQFHARRGLEMYQDKIALSLEFRRRGLPVPQVYYSSYDRNFDVRPILRQFEKEGRPFVAKASHMCCSQGVFVMDGGVNRVDGSRPTTEDIQETLQGTFDHPFGNISPKCGDWGTVEAGKRPGVLIEEMMQPSIPLDSILEPLGGGDWITPDILACHLVWSTVLTCVWEVNVRKPSGKVHTEALGIIFRDGSCLSCRFPMPFRAHWPSTVSLLERLLPHADYLRVTLFGREGRPVLNEIEYTCGGLETVHSLLAHEWNLRWITGYYQWLS